MLSITFLIGLLLLCVVSDFKSRRIPNAAVCIGAVTGLSLSYLQLNGDITFLHSFLGALVGLGLFLPVYLLGKMGAGDVKLLAMCGCFLGPESTLMAALCAMLVGGFLAIGWVGLLKAFPIKDKRYPYAAAIAIGALIAPYIHFA